MSVFRWARLQVSASCGLRLGAWYPVTALTVREAHVRIQGRIAKIPRDLLEFRTTPPREWTVVRGPLSATRVPASVREGYLVCPNCRHRDPLPEARSGATRCPRCNEVFAVAWEEPYPRTAAGVRERHPAYQAVSREVTRPVRDTAKRDPGMSRRRGSVSRRSGRMRRVAERRATGATPLAERRVADRRQGGDRRRGRERRGVMERRRRP
jgi:hypothetical protein